METVKANKDNDLKFREGLNIPKKEEPKKVTEAVEQPNASKPKLEYFTE